MKKETLKKLGLLICSALTILIGVMIVIGVSHLPKLTYEDIEITGVITKQYTEYHAMIATSYYTVIDYGGDYVKVINDQDYYNNHNIGDTVKLTKHRTYKGGKWISTTIEWE